MERKGHEGREEVGEGNVEGKRGSVMKDERYVNTSHFRILTI